LTDERNCWDSFSDFARRALFSFDWQVESGQELKWGLALSKAANVPVTHFPPTRIKQLWCSLAA
jgi:hypothetical protein